MSEEHAGAAAERARVLQDHLVRTAYALHFTAADLAAQHERRADMKVPSAFDHRVQAKRWLALSDHALDIVRRWDQRSDGGPSRSDQTAVDAGRGTKPRRPVPEEALEMAHSAIERLFRASLKLHAVMPLADEGIQDHLQEAAVELDHAVRDIRGFVIEIQADDEATDS